MGLFGKRARECDWCGRAIEGEGLHDGDLLLCSQACIDLKNTPAATSARTVPDLRNATVSLASSDLALAARDLAECERIAGLGEAADLRTLERARDAYFACWRRLATVRRMLSARRSELREFDALHRSFLDTADVLDISPGATGGRAAVMRATISDRERVGAALALLQRALADAG